MDPDPRAPTPPLRPVAPDRYADFTPVGEGGQGIVYWALDTELNREVAFKVLRPGGGSGADDVTPEAPLELRAPTDDAERRQFAEREQRFLQEAWITAGMEHQGILPVYELGRTADGVPYYTMRYVTGSRTLADALAEVRGAPLEERLRLLEPFLQVCDALRYAHDRGVVHRDVKPANVALGEYGEVVVLDWGLAKLEGRPDVAADDWRERLELQRTRAGARTLTSALGTPGTMAPEATRGEVEAIDARSDVYSLGAILFELLAGRPHVAFSGLDEYARKVATERITPASLGDEVPEPLAELCARALALDPADRPQGVAEVAEALRAWLRSSALDREAEALATEARLALDAACAAGGRERLEALDRVATHAGRILELRPEDVAARALLDEGRRLREQGVRERERAARAASLRRAGLVSVVALAVVATIAAALVERRRREAETARQDAVAAREEAEDLMGFLVFELQEGLAPVGRSELLEEIGGEALRYYAELELEGSPPHSLVNRTVALRNLAEAQRAGGDLAAALEAYRASAEAAAHLVAVAPDDEEAPYLLSLAEVGVGRTLFDQGYTRNALAAFERHLAAMEALVERQPDSPEYRGALAAACAFVGDALGELGRWDECLAHHERALAVAQDLERTAAIDDPATSRRARSSWRTSVVESHLASSRALRGLGRPERALARVELATARTAELVAEHPDDLRWVHLRARCDLRAAGVHLQWGEWTAAAPLVEAALADLRLLVERDPAHLGWRSTLVGAVQRRGDLIALDDPATASDLYRDALDDLDELIERDPSNARWRNLAITLCDRVARAGGDPAEVLALRRRAQEDAWLLVEREADNYNWRHILAYTTRWLAQAVATEEPERALELYRLALDTGRPILADNPAEFELGVLMAQAAELLADLLAQRGELDAADAELAAAIELLAGVRDAFEAPPLPVLETLAWLLQRQVALLAPREPERARDRAARAAAAFVALRDADGATDYHTRSAARGLARLEATLEELR